MTLHPIPSEFPYMRKIYFSFLSVRYAPFISVNFSSLSVAGRACQCMLTGEGEGVPNQFEGVLLQAL
jgi:hypothetical protein